jgi:hypothetical protein
MVEKKEYKEFRSLVRRGMGARSQKKFAEDCGLSQEHLSRMLTGEKISRPSKVTLSKIVRGSNGLLTYKELYTACNYDEKEAESDKHSDRVHMSMYERMKAVSNDIEVGFKELIKEARMYADINSILQAFMEKHNVDIIKMKALEQPKESDIADKNGEYYICMSAEWVTRRCAGEEQIFRVKNYFVLFYAKTSHNHYILTDVAIDMRTLLECGGVEEGVVDSLYEDGQDVENLPFYAQATKEEMAYTDVEKRLLKSIFGSLSDEPNSDYLRLWHTQFGDGFTYTGVPEGLRDFILKHKDMFTADEEEVEFVEEIETNAGVDFEEMFKDYYVNYEKGVPAVICMIINRLFEKEGIDAEVVYGESDKYAEKLPPCIYVKEEWFCNGDYLDKEKKDKVIGRFLELAKELKVKTFGAVIVYTSSDTQFTDLQDAIEY